MKFNFSKKELDLLVDNMVIIIDTREQENSHIVDYFKRTNKEFIIKKLDRGDYSLLIKSNDQTKELGIFKDLIFDDIVIERKGSIDELIGNFAERNRIENEFKSAKYSNKKTKLLIEDEVGYSKICAGNYKSKMSAKSIIATLESFCDRYDIEVQFIDKKLIGMKIYTILKYSFLNSIKGER